MKKLPSNECENMSKCIELFDSSPIIDAISFADFDEIFHLKLF